MDFNDRLRNQLQTQNDELGLSPEGTHAVRARSRLRKQRRTGGTILATVLVALVVGGWIVGRSGDTEENLATEGDANSVDDATSANTEDIAGSTDATDPIERALPDPGAPLVLTAANNVDAPGGYNVYQSGRSGGLYYVLSTAPGLRYEDLKDGADAFRNDTVYTFDGSEWSQSATGDRFVSTIDANESGLLYTVSTGTTGGPALELGTSSNAGQDWSWTELDLSSTLGSDRSTWPPYSVQFATRGTETVVIVHTLAQIDWTEAAELAAANGAAIDPTSSEVLNVDQSGISWIDDLEESDPCLAALSDAVAAAWENEPEVREFDVDRELSEAELAERGAYWNELDQRAERIYSEALQSVARVPGCVAFVKCTNEHTALLATFDDELERIYAGSGGEELSDDELAELDALYATQTDEIAEWAKTSGCDEVTPYLLGGEQMEDYGNYASWEELGVVLPDSWSGTTTGFLVDDGEVTNLGEIFGGQDGYLLQVRTNDEGWVVTFDRTFYDETTPTISTYTIWTSVDGTNWTSTTSDSVNFSRPVELANGTTFVPDWSSASTQLLRVTADGTAAGLTLADLAPDLDTTGYQIMNVRSGDYGVVAWAVKWQDVDEGDQPYDSIVLYSPDGVGWGATAVPDVEVVEVIVGDEEVVLFLNDPDRPEGAAQPIKIGRA